MNEPNLGTMSTPPRIVLEVPREPSLEDGPWSPRWPEQAYYYDGRSSRLLLDEEQAEPRSSLDTIATPYHPAEPKKDPDLVS